MWLSFCCFVFILWMYVCYVDVPSSASALNGPIIKFLRGVGIPGWLNGPPLSMRSDDVCYVPKNTTYLLTYWGNHLIEFLVLFRIRQTYLSLTFHFTIHFLASFSSVHSARSDSSQLNCIWVESDRALRKWLQRSDKIDREAECQWQISFVGAWFLPVRRVAA